MEKLSLTAELIWTVTLYWFYIFQSIWYLAFPPEPKDVKDEIILVSICVFVAITSYRGWFSLGFYKIVNCQSYRIVDLVEQCTFTGSAVLLRFFQCPYLLTFYLGVYLLGIMGQGWYPCFHILEMTTPISDHRYRARHRPWGCPEICEAWGQGGVRGHQPQRQRGDLSAHQEAERKSFSIWVSVKETFDTFLSLSQNANRFWWEHIKIFSYWNRKTFDCEIRNCSVSTTSSSFHKIVIIIYEI